MSGLVRDVRYALRALMRAPGLTGAAVATLALVLTSVAPGGERDPGPRARAHQPDGGAPQ